MTAERLMLVMRSLELELMEVARFPENTQIPVQPQLFCIAPQMTEELESYGCLSHPLVTKTYLAFVKTRNGAVPFIRPRDYDTDYFSYLRYNIPTIKTELATSLCMTECVSRFYRPLDWAPDDYTVAVDTFVRRWLELSIFTGEL
jgi:hypothetical protein